jgi:hypothetical protein
LIYLGLLIVSTGAISVSGSEQVAVESIAHWRFGLEEDANFDGFPDGWKRKTGREYPLFQRVTQVPYSEPWAALVRQLDRDFQGYLQLFHRWSGNSAQPAPSLTDRVDRFLRIEVNGGGTMLESQKFPVSEGFSYHLSAKQMCEDLKRSQAWIEIVFHDRHGNAVVTRESTRIGGSSPWSYVAIGPLPTPMKATMVSVRLRVEPNGRADVRGVVGFDQVHLRRLPQLTIETDDPTGVYGFSSHPKIICKLSGLSQEGARVRLVARDQDQVVQLEQELDTVLGSLGGDGFLSGHVQWQPQFPRPGWYLISAQLVGTDVASMAGERAIVILSDLPKSTAGSFGISFAEGLSTIPVQRLPSWLHDLRMGWVKIGCWLPPGDRESSDQMAWLMERLNDRGINTVGVLAIPPEEVKDKFGDTSQSNALQLFRDRAVWQPLLESQMSRLSLRVNWWQLGLDQDTSFAEASQPSETLDQIREGLQGFGQPVSLVVGWPLLEPLRPDTKAGAWNAVHYSHPLALAADEVPHYTTQRQQSLRQSWFECDPLPKGEYSLEARVRDLVERMVAFRSNDAAQAVFASRVYDPACGLLRADGTPTEMFLPFRTTASLVGNLQNIGSIQLPQGSENRVLADENRAIMVVWNDRGTEESAYLGEHITQFDVWGNELPMRKRPDGRHEFTVGPWPTFLVGIDPLAAMWRMGIEVLPERLDSLSGRYQMIELVVRNPSNVSANGQVHIIGPSTWRIEPRQANFQVEPSGVAKIPLQVIFAPNATTGNGRIQMDFSIDAQRSVRFHLWRDLEVGPADLSIDVTASVDARNQLVVRQEIVNTGPAPYRLKCLLYAHNRPYETMRLEIPAGQRLLRNYILQNGNELIGTDLLLSIIEQKTDRTMNYRLKVSGN